jgi:hypothetical protein
MNEPASGCMRYAMRRRRLYRETVIEVAGVASEFLPHCDSPSLNLGHGCFLVMCCAAPQDISIFSGISRILTQAFPQRSHEADMGIESCALVLALESQSTVLWSAKIVDVQSFGARTSVE